MIKKKEKEICKTLVKMSRNTQKDVRLSPSTGEAM